MYESIEVIFRESRYSHEGNLQRTATFDKPESVTTEYGVLAIGKGNKLHLFPLDTVQEAVITLAEGT